MYRLAIVFIFIYSTVIASGFEILLPTLKGYSAFLPSVTWSPLLLFATLLLSKSWMSNIQRLKYVLIYLGITSAVLLLHFLAVRNFAASRVMALGTYFHFYLLMIFWMLALSDTKVRKVALVGIVSGVSIAVLINLVERVFSLPFTVQSNRSAGFFLNANVSAESIVFCLFALKAGNFFSRSYNILMGLSGLAIGATFSRSGIFLYLINLVLVFWKKGLEVRLFLKSFLLGGLILLATIFLVSFGDIVQSLGTKAMQGIDDVSSSANAISEDFRKAYDIDRSAVGNLKNRVTYDQSAAQRVELGAWALNLIIEDGIIFGYGVGYLHGAYQRTHNFLLESWIELGVFSILFLPALLMYLWKPQQVICSKDLAILLLVNSFFSHNLVNSKIIAFTISLVLIQLILVEKKSVERREY